MRYVGDNGTSCSQERFSGEEYLQIGLKHTFRKAFIKIYKTRLRLPRIEVGGIVAKAKGPSSIIREQYWQQNPPRHDYHGGHRPHTRGGLGNSRH